MRRSRRDSGLQVTLFPCLAVLLCLMGSLIVLLVVLVRQANVEAADVSRQQVMQQQSRVEELEQIRQEAEDAQWRFDVLQESHAKTAEELDLKRRELSHVEEEMRRLREALDQAANEAAEIERQSRDKTTADQSAQVRVETLKAQVAAAEGVEAARQTLKDKAKKVSYSIIPYVGESGTFRRPIYVECLADRVILQPEGIELTSEDFEEPITDDNALASMLRAVREYWKAASGDSESLPYPLLIVRPSGTQAYAAARAAMKSWETEFGYELVEDEMRLAYPDKDPTLATILQEAVVDARERRRHLQAIAPARFGRGGTPSVLTASRGGGFVDGSGGPAGRGVHGNGRGSSRDATAGPAGLSQSPAHDGRAIHGSSEAGDGREGGELGNSMAGMGGDGNGQPGGAGTHNGGRSGGAARAATAGDKSANADGPLPLARPGQPEGGAQGGADGAAHNGDRSVRSTSGNAVRSAASAGTGGRSGSETAPGGEKRATADASAGRLGAAGHAASGGAANGNGASSSSGAGQDASGGQSGAVASFGARKAAGGPGATRGHNWGLPDAAGNTTGITRQIQLVCSAKQLSVLPESRRRSQEIVVPVDGSMRDEVDTLVSHIWKRIDSWGIAGHNMYWKPTLMVRVEPGGEERFEELVEQLQNSGIDVKRKPSP